MTKVFYPCDSYDKQSEKFNSKCYSTWGNLHKINFKIYRNKVFSKIIYIRKKSIGNILLPKKNVRKNVWKSFSSKKKNLEGPRKSPVIYHTSYVLFNIYIWWNNNVIFCPKILLFSVVIYGSLYTFLCVLLQIRLKKILLLYYPCPLTLIIY